MATSGIGQSGKEGLIENAVLIAGPTASGKSAVALDLARRLGGTVVNADSMQVYSVLDLLTARPGAEEQAVAPHLLYGHVHPASHYSTGAWLGEVAALAGSGALSAGPPIFVGGTGLYFRALAEGISAMPAIPADVRQAWRSRLAAEGAEALHAELARRDQAAAERLKPGDSQRIVRALEVLDASGLSILEWQGRTGTPLIDRASARFVVIEPDRHELIGRIDRRFDLMVERGAIEEVRRLTALGLDPALPAMKAIGVREIQAAIADEISLDEAIARAKIATRQYAKRQATWFRNQLGPEWLRFQLMGTIQHTDLNDFIKPSMK